MTRSCSPDDSRVRGGEGDTESPEPVRDLSWDRTGPDLKHNTDLGRSNNGPSNHPLNQTGVHGHDHRPRLNDPGCPSMSPRRFRADRRMAATWLDRRRGRNLAERALERGYGTSTSLHCCPT